MIVYRMKGVAVLDVFKVLLLVESPIPYISMTLSVR
jgi:hypothetical protein